MVLFLPWEKKIFYHQKRECKRLTLFWIWPIKKKKKALRWKAIVSLLAQVEPFLGHASSAVWPLWLLPKALTGKNVWSKGWGRCSLSLLSRTSGSGSLDVPLRFMGPEDTNPSTRFHHNLIVFLKSSGEPNPTNPNRKSFGVMQEGVVCVTRPSELHQSFLVFSYTKKASCPQDTGVTYRCPFCVICDVYRLAPEEQSLLNEGVRKERWELTECPLHCARRPT